MLRGTQTNVELEPLPCVMLVVTDGGSRTFHWLRLSLTLELPQDGDNGSLLAMADLCMRSLYAAAIRRPSHTYRKHISNRLN
jgi:hypothetical protein